MGGRAAPACRTAASRTGSRLARPSIRARPASPGDHEQPVVAAGAQAADRAHGVAAATVGDQPLPARPAGQVDRRPAGRTMSIMSSVAARCHRPTTNSRWVEVRPMSGHDGCHGGNNVTEECRGRRRRRGAGTGSRQADAGEHAWRAWGPYLAERAWGTVREDYSEHGTAWDYFPHDHARSRAYRWNEDGLAGLCDDRQTFCFALALWNGEDPILKERIFGLTGDEGNHGEDAKEYWWYLDSTPTHSWMSWRYHYPQREFPYDELVAVNRAARPGRARVRAGRHRDLRRGPVLGGHRRLRQGRPRPTCASGSRSHNRGPGGGDPARAAHAVVPQHLGVGAARPRPTCPTLDGSTAAPLVAEHRILGPAGAGRRRRARRRWSATTRPTRNGCGGCPAARRTRRTASTTTWSTARTRSTRPGGHQGRAALRAGRAGRASSRQIRLRLARWPPPTVVARVGRARHAAPTSARGFDEVMSRRAAPRPTRSSPSSPRPAPRADEALVLRQAVAGLMWGKQFYHYDVAALARRRPGRPPPPAGRGTGATAPGGTCPASTSSRCPTRGSTPGTPPGTWPSTASPSPGSTRGFAKDQLLLLLREWYMHPNGQIPAYEWAFDDVNPPVHALGRAEGLRDRRRAATTTSSPGSCTSCCSTSPGGSTARTPAATTSSRAASSAWTTSARSTASAALPVAGVLEQSDGTAWMAMYALNLLEMALVLADRTTGPTWTWRPSSSSTSPTSPTAAYEQGLWDERGRLLLRRAAPAPTATQVPLKVRSVVGLLPLAATTIRSARSRWPACPRWPRRLRWFLDQQARVRRGGRRPAASRRRPAAAPAVRGRPGAAAADPGAGCSTRRSSSPRTGCARCPARTWTSPFTVHARRARLHRRLRAGRVDQRPVRRQLQLARPDLVPGELPAHRGAAPTTPVLRRRPAWWSTRPAPGQKRTLGEIADDLSAPAGLAVPARTPTGAGRSTARYELFQTHPDWHDLIAVPRVLPRRHRRRAGRLAPDRLDRAGRRPDHVPAPAPPPLGGGRHR